MEKLSKKQLQKLRTKSKNWTSEKWEEYLQTLEVECSETLIHPYKYEELMEENPFLWEDYEKNNSNDEIISHLKKALKTLTPRQKKVIKMLFWDNLTGREIAIKLRRSRRTIRSIKDQGLQKLKKYFCNKVSPLSLYIEGESLSDALKSISKTNSSDSFFELKNKGENDVA